MTYDKYIKNIELFKKKYKGVWSILIPKDNEEEIIGELETTFDKYYYLVLRRPSLMEFSLYQKHIDNKDLISATEVILNNCVLEGDTIIKDNDEIFLSLVFNTSFTEDFVKSLGMRKTKINTKSLDLWVRKDDNQEDVTEDFVRNNSDLYDHFEFRKLNRNDLRDSRVFDSIIQQQQLIHNLCINGDKSLILTNDEIFYSIFSSGILNLMFENKFNYLKKN